jgi:hypothetical protein
VDAGFGQQRAPMGDRSLAPGDRLLVQSGGFQVPVDPLQTAEADGLSTLRAVENADIVHRQLLLNAVRRGRLAHPGWPARFLASSSGWSADRALPLQSAAK